MPTADPQQVGAPWVHAAEQAFEAQAQALRQRAGQDFQQLWRKTRVSMEVALGGRVSEPTDLLPEVASLQAEHAEILTPSRGGSAWTEALDPLLRAGRRVQRRWWLLLFMGLGIVTAGVVLKLTWLLAIGGGTVTLAVFGVWGSRKSLARKYRAAWTELASAETSRVLQAAGNALQAWLQRSFQAFSAQYRPLLESCANTRTQQESRHQEIEDMRKNFAELTRQLLSP
jgi:Flp pilus assembly protein TadB